MLRGNETVWPTHYCIEFLTVLFFFYGTLSVLAPILLLCFWLYMAVLLCLIYDFPGVVHLK